jgi:hypothetical protein
MADDEEYAKNRFNTAIPAGLTHMPPPTHMPLATHMPQHILGTVGQGRDLQTENNPAPDPIVNGAPTSQAGGSKQIIIIDDDMVARYYLITATLVGDVP